jgi:hypothetical protein
VLVTIVCLAAACSDRVAEQAGVPVVQCGAPGDSGLKSEANGLVSRLVAGINARNPIAVASVSAFPGEDPDTSAARAAIEGFRHHLQDHVIECRFVGHPEGWDSHLEYMLIGASGASKAVVVYHDEFRNHSRVYDEFLAYFSRAQHYAPAVMDAVRRRDAQRLARLLSPDDLDYPVPLAEQAIAGYASRFDLPTLRIDYKGLDPSPAAGYGPDVRRWFGYTVHGMKDGQPVAHDILIIHGDGLIGWRDPMVPDYRGT